MNTFIINLFQRFKIYFVNSGWVLFGYAVRLIIIVFIISKIAGQIGTGNFGWYNLGISFFTILFSISTLGFDSPFVINKLVQEKDNIEGQKLLIGSFLISRVFVSILIIVSLGIWVVFFTNISEYWIVFIATLSILFQTSEIISFYYQWKLRANVYISFEISSLIISSMLLVLGLYMKYSVYYFISIYSLERLLYLIGLLVFFNYDIFRIRDLKINFKSLKSLTYSSWPLLTGAILTALYGRFDQFLISEFLTIKDLGIYGPSVILTQIWLVVPALIVPVLFPKIAELKRENNKEKYEKLIYGLFGLLNYSAICIIIFTFLFGDWVIRFLYGEEYLNSIVILNIMIFNLLVLFQSQLTTSVLIIEGQEKYLFLTKFVGVTVNIALNIYFLQKYGVVFASYALIISSVASWFFMSCFNKTMFSLVKTSLSSFFIIFHIRSFLK